MKKEKAKLKSMMLIGLTLSSISLYVEMSTTHSVWVLITAILGVIVTSVTAIFSAEIIEAEYLEEDYNDPKYDFDENKKAEFITLDERKWNSK